MLDGLPHRHYAVIVADVPWAYKARSEKGQGRAPEKHYKTMALDEIRRLDVGAHAAEDCHLFFWVTGPFLAIGAHVDICRSWGFEPTAIWGVWLKPTKSKFHQGQFFIDDTLWKMGLGKTSRQNAEFVVIGRKGSPKRLSASVRQIMTEPLRKHSQKPEIFYKNVVKYAPGPYLELFGRQQRENWTVVGDEANKF